MDNSEHPLESTLTAAKEGSAFFVHPNLSRLEVSGADRLDLLHRLSTNDLVSLKSFSASDTIFLTEKGRIIDCVRVLVFPESLLLVTTPYQESRLKTWIEKYTIMEDIQLDIPSDDAQMTSVFGPHGKRVMISALDGFSGDRDLEVARFGDVGIVVDSHVLHDNRWFNIFVPKEVSDAFHECLARLGSKEMDVPAYEYYRIIHGVPSISELAESFNPFDIGRRDTVSFSKGCYIGQEVIARLDTYQKIRKGLILLSFEQRINQGNLPMAVSDATQDIGLLTSASARDFDGSYAGLAVMKTEHLHPGSSVTIGQQPFGIGATVSKVFGWG